MTRQKALMPSRTYVLVHGAWHGGWVWRDVAPALRAMGHIVTTPTMTGLGERKHLARPDIDLDLHVQDIVAHIEMEELDDVVLVGWSYGGMVIAGVLARLPERVASMVYLDAFIPENGKALVDYVASASAESIKTAVSSGGLVPPIPPERFGVTDPDVIAFLMPRLVDHPPLTMSQGVKALPERPAGLPHTYIRCTRQNPSQFDDFLAQCKADPQFETYVLETSHICMLTDPRGTVELLAKVG